jgi:hypothetical protein
VVQWFVRAGSAPKSVIFENAESGMYLGADQEIKDGVLIQGQKRENAAEFYIGQATYSPSYQTRKM